MPKESKKILQRLPKDKLAKIERNCDELEMIDLQLVSEEPEEQPEWQELSKTTKQQDRSGFK